MPNSGVVVVDPMASGAGTTFEFTQCLDTIVFGRIVGTSGTSAAAAFLDQAQTSIWASICNARL